MEFSLVTIGLLLVAALSIVIGVKILLNRTWFLGFIRGNIGVALLLGAAFFALAAINIATYSSVSENKVIANISFKQVDAQTFSVQVTDSNSGKQHKISVEGDLWSISARQLSLLMSAEYFYQLDHIEGRFYTLEQQKRAGDSRVFFPSKSMGINLWQQFNKRYSPLIAASYKSSAFIPIADDALFSVSIRADRLSVLAMNTAAKKAVSQ